MKNLSRSFVFILMMFVQTSWGINGQMPDQVSLQLRDGRHIEIDRTGDNSQRLSLMKSKKVLWEKDFEQEYDRLWTYAFFVPICKGRYLAKISKGGYSSIAVGTWDGGNSMDHRSVLIFKVREDRLEFVKTEPFNLEYGRHVYDCDLAKNRNHQNRNGN